jgi:ABC-type uncharacterized transport system auxiliary subunit
MWPPARCLPSSGARAAASPRCCARSSGCCLFAAVIAPGSRGTADLSLEGELTTLWVNLATRMAEATIAVTAIDLRVASRRILLQASFTGTSPCANTQPATLVQAQRAALEETFAAIESSIRSNGIV